MNITVMQIYNIFIIKYTPKEASSTIMRRFDNNPQELIKP